MPKPFLDRLIPEPSSGKAQHIFRIPCTNPGLYDVFLVLVLALLLLLPYKFPRLNLCWEYLQNGSIMTLGMNVKEIKAAASAHYWIGIQDRSVPISH